MADDGEREGGNKVARGRAASAGQMGRGWTQSSSASIPVQAGTSRSYRYMRGEVWLQWPAAQQLAVVLIALRCRTERRCSA